MKGPTLCIATAHAPPPPPPPAKQFRIKLQGWTGAAETNFPFYFSGDLNIPPAFWTGIVDPNGLDIRFFDTDGVTELLREIVSVDTVGHTIEAHVQIPSAVTNKIIYCKWGGTTVANSTAMWTGIGATGIYHLQEVVAAGAPAYSHAAYDSSGRIDIDYSVANIYGYTLPAPVAAKCGKGYLFIDGRVTGDILLPMHSGVYTVFLWANLTQPSFGTHDIEISGDVTESQEILLRRADSSYNGPNQSNGNTGWAAYQYQGTLGEAGAITNTSFASELNAWHRVVAQYEGDATHVFNIFVDGILKDSYNIAPYNLRAAGLSTALGAHWVGQGPLGMFDEVQYYNDKKSITWIANEYANQNAPVTFAVCL